MRKKILVPTDFSANALSAARYAGRIAQQNNYDLHLFHCYTTSTVDTADEHMQALKTVLLQEFPTLQIDTECVSRLLIDVLPDYAVAPKFALIVMGTTGAGKGKSVIWGSNTALITSKAKVPVIAIPTATEAFSTEKVAILTNFKAEEIETLNNYINDVSPIKHLDIIHIYKDTKQSAKIQQELEDWTFNIKQLSGIEAISIIAKPIEHDNEELDTIPEMINHIITTNNYDSILVTKTRKSFFERLMNTSVSRHITLTLQKPTFFDNI